MKSDNVLGVFRTLTVFNKIRICSSVKLESQSLNVKQAPSLNIVKTKSLVYHSKVHLV